MVTDLLVKSVIFLRCTKYSSIDLVQSTLDHFITDLLSLVALQKCIYKQIHELIHLKSNKNAPWMDVVTDYDQITLPGDG